MACFREPFQNNDLLQEIYGNMTLALEKKHETNIDSPVYLNIFLKASTANKLRCSPPTERIISLILSTTCCWSGRPQVLAEFSEFSCRKWVFNGILDCQGSVWHQFYQPNFMTSYFWIGDRNPPKLNERQKFHGEKKHMQSHDLLKQIWSRNSNKSPPLVMNFYII